MKNRTPIADQRNQAQSLDWIHGEQEDDFLLGKTPSEFQGVWDEEE